MVGWAGSLSGRLVGRKLGRGGCSGREVVVDVGDRSLENLNEVTSGLPLTGWILEAVDFRSEVGKERLGIVVLSAVGDDRGGSGDGDRWKGGGAVQAEGVVGGLGVPEGVGGCKNEGCVWVSRGNHSDGAREPTRRERLPEGECVAQGTGVAGSANLDVLFCTVV